MKLRLFLAIMVLIGALGTWVLQAYSPAQRGEKVFAQLGCVGCHFSGAGPNLNHVVRKYDDGLLARFLTDPAAVYRERNMQPLNNGYNLMPRVQATREDVRAILAYLHELDKQ